MQNCYRPYFMFRPLSVKTAVDYYKTHLGEGVLYAVKANPNETVLSTLYDAGIRKFDVASLGEVIRIRTLFPDAEIYFMHPVKSRFAIRESYFKHKVRHFSLDSEMELHKILQETDDADDLCLYLRLSVPNSYAEINLSNKFGIDHEKAPDLLKLISQRARKLGICFHVGSQCMHPQAYRLAIQAAKKVIDYAGVRLDFFNVGGGFPSVYPGMIPPPLIDYFTIIHQEFSQINQDGAMTLLCEPGRSLVAESMSVVVRVNLRREHDLYINDGTYGSLFDAGSLKFIFPTRLLRESHEETADYLPFQFYGPTCDGIDFMPGPFYLPSDIDEGDYIEVGQIGAYGQAMATGFNGFGHEKELIITDSKPLMTMFGDDVFKEQAA
ncbi:MAG: type III PLP-dependent enzyme [Pseudomonadota bacterium]